MSHDNWNMELNWSIDRIICCKVNNVMNSMNWNLLACYGTPYPGEKQDFLSDLEEIILALEGPWLLIGDLNKIISHLEKNSGRSIWKR